jgi:hypothetical protein
MSSYESQSPFFIICHSLERLRFLFPTLCILLTADHPQAAAPDADTPAMSLEDVLEELEAGGGEDMILVDADGRRMMGDGVVEMLAGVMGRSVC